MWQKYTLIINVYVYHINKDITYLLEHQNTKLVFVVSKSNNLH